jgi:hypothetical protein
MATFSNRTMFVPILLCLVCGCGSGPTTPSGTGTDGSSSGTPSPGGTAPRTWIVDAKPGADFTSIAQAAREAGAQDTIKVRPGTYSSTSVVLSKPITLVGEGKASEIILQCEKSIAIVADSPDIKVSNLTIVANAYQPAVHARSGKFTMDGCTVTCKLGTAVLIGIPADATLTNNTFSDSKVGLDSSGKLRAEKNVFSNNESAAQLRGQSCSFKFNRVTGCTQDAILINDCTAPPLIEENEVYSNKRHGIVVMGKVNPMIRKNKIYQIAFSGVQFDNESTGVCEDNEIYDCHSGVRLWKCVNPQINHNKIHDNNCGVVAEEKSTGVADSNDIWNSEVCGVFSDNGADIKVTHNKIHDNGTHGCRVVSKMTIEDNEIFKNAVSGINIHNGVCEARGNSIHHNDFVGVYLREGSTVTFCKNHIFENATNGVNVAEKPNGTFEENDLRGNTFGAFKIDPAAFSTVKRSKNTLDPCAFSHAKVGDWYEAKISATGPGMRGEQLRVTVTEINDDEVVCAERSWIDGQEHTSVIHKVMGRQRTFLDDFLLNTKLDLDFKEVRRGEETLTVGGKELSTNWIQYALTPSDPKAPKVTIKMKVWTSDKIAVDETVKATVELPNHVTVEMNLIAFGDASTPKPVAPKKTAVTPAKPAENPVPPPAVKPPASPATPPKADSPKPPPAAAETPEKPKSKPQKITVIKLKDGRQITATAVVETGEQYSVKDADGKFQLINKDDVEEMKKE